MQVLEKTLRNKLERTVMEARDVAEAAARAAAEQLGVGEPKPYVHLSAGEKELRRKLRIHGRQLGDFRHAKKETQEIDRLVEEIAYEHWHRMLFARFLAENNLLMYPDPDEPVAVSLEECEDLSADEGAKNGWELASRFAARMLPQIFRPDSPVFQLDLPPEHQQKLERLLAELPEEVFHASDSLGWVYQFWQAKKKDEVNRSEVKIGARELPAVTQLFTEPYMVAFLLDNSLGAWWAARRLTEDDLANAKNEDELRRKASLPGVPLEYLRFVKDKNGRWIPAAGTFDGWPENLAELKTLDPCCGSGHFLVAAFLMLVPMRMDLEGLSAREAVDRVLAENIHGLEIDQRCVELAAFALALAAWRYPGAGGYRQLPELNVACSGLSVSVSSEEWQKLANGNHNLRIALGWIYDEFQNAPVLGSLLDPSKIQLPMGIRWKDIAGTLETALAKEGSDEKHEAGVVAHGLARAASLLAGKYHWVITNVPYLARGKQGEKLREFCEKNYKEAKNDLATVFLDRCLELCVEGGTPSVVLPQNWLFLTSYRKFREKLLKNETWYLIARLGPGAFQTPMWDFNVQLLTIRRGTAFDEEFSFQLSGGSSRDIERSNVISGLDVSAPRTAAEKSEQLITAAIKKVEQAKQLENPDARVLLSKLDSLNYLSEIAISQQGITTGDLKRFGLLYWELPKIEFGKYRFWQSTTKEIAYFQGRELVIKWDAQGCSIENVRGATLRGSSTLGQYGVVVSLMRELPVTLGTGELGDDNTTRIIPKNAQDASAIWCFCSSPDYNAGIREVDQSLKVMPNTALQVPFDLDRWTKVAAEEYPNGLPKPYSDDPTQWIFHGHPCGSVIWDEEKKWTAHGLLRTDSTVLQVAVARLLGYRWPAELDSEMELSDEARALVARCDDLLKYADKDGIVCIPPVRGEPSAADRLLNLLAAAYGDQWSTDKLSELLKASDHAGKTLDSWLRDKFFAQHCRLFHQRPFIWHIWDGLRDGFSVLVNYHKLDRKNLETLIYTYLGDWIRRQKDDISSGVDGAQERLAAAETLKKRLELILEGEAPYDIFVRWKPIEKQPVGWEPDLGDGVRLNIRPFMSVPDARPRGSRRVKRKGAGCLREKPKIHWKKDRGKDVESAPWYHLFKGDRINDYHLGLDEKRAAREDGNP